MEELEKLEKELEAKEEKWSERKKELYSKVVKFTNTIRKQFGDLIKSVLIFGSFVRGDMKKTSDVDVWVILDDTATKSSEDLNKLISSIHLVASELKDLHVQTTPLTEFWKWIREGSPELVNFLRYGLPIYDVGFIKPVQRMLQLGLIPPSEEAIKLKARTAEARLKRIKLDIGAMIFDLRYAAMDAIQAAVMHLYKQQPDAKAIPSFLEKMKNEGKIDEKYIALFKELDKLWKDIDHKIVKPNPEHLKRALEIAEEIVKEFKKFVPGEEGGKT